jgi:methionyl-tRNA formyltransferase
MFENIIVIGSGTVANRCAKILKTKNYNPLFCEILDNSIFSSKNFCSANEIDFIQVEKKEIKDYFLNISAKTLIVSASNRYLFPLDILLKENISVINYHGSLLPKFPGRNAEAWAIFEGERIGGITWHYVVTDIDAGDLIIQKSTPISSKTTSVSLLRDYSILAINAFEEIIDGVISDTIVSKPQNSSQKESIRYSWVKPNEGELDLDWDGTKISVFLRAMNYGPLKTFGEPFFRYNQQTYTFSKYEISENEDFENISNFELSKLYFCIQKNSNKFILKNLKISK